ncbi:MAG: VWA domain-containing protein, partial [Bacteroidales bacterium]|nr:VWA domain-containing protein [Bacteroidales bacterium]
MIHFASAQYLLLIFVIPFFFIFYALYRRGRRRKIEALGDVKLLERLMPARSKVKGWVRISFFSAAWFFFVIGLARPQIGARLKETNRKGAEIMIALDVSNSMLAEDYSPNRLERAKLAISRLVDKLHGDRIGLIVFAGQSFVQLPITTDYVSAKIFLNSINTESVPVQGTALGDAIYTAMRSFSGEGHMGEGNKAIILITDGENHEDDPITAATAAAQEGIRVFCIGVGSPEGKPIPMDGDLLKDKDGNIVVTKLDESVLEEVAIAGEGAYVKAGNTEFGLNPIIDKLKELQEQEFKSQVFEDFDEQYMYFFAIALFFFLLEFIVGNRRSGKKLFAIAFVLLMSGYTANAQTDRREVRKGNREFEKENYKEAEVEYRKALIKDSLSVAANYNLGNVLYRMEDPANAEKNFKTATDSVSRIPMDIDWKKGEVRKGKRDASSDVYHNLGNTYLAQKKYGEAVEAYKNSLKRNPGDMDTKTNLAYAQKMLEDQQNQG